MSIEQKFIALGCAFGLFFLFVAIKEYSDEKLGTIEYDFAENLRGEK